MVHLLEVLHTNEKAVRSRSNSAVMEIIYKMHVSVLKYDYVLQRRFTTN